LRQEQQKRPTLAKAEFLYNVKKEGAGQVVLVGLPNSGKSSVLSEITHATSEVGDFPFTTQRPIPGMMPFENIQIQLVDTPPIQLNHTEPGFSNLVRNANALLLVVDLMDDPVFQTEVLLEKLKDMKVVPLGKGSIPSGETGEVFLKSLLIGNKCDLKGATDHYHSLESRFKEALPIVPISTKEKMNLDVVKQEIYQLLGIIRVYTKAPGKEADLSEPVILKKGSRVEDVALSIHKDFSAKLRYAKIWGSGKYDGQMVKRDHRVNEGDVIEMHI
jgi:ribosome-interacting GTPase 1